MKDSGVNSLAAATPSEITIETKSSLPIPSKAATMPAELKKEWNTKNLGARLGADLTSAAAAASLVAPLISIIDKYEQLLFLPRKLPVPESKTLTMIGQ